MPKQKTRKSAVKRFSQTSSGKLMHRHTRRAHGMVAKSPSRSRKLYNEASVYPGRVKMLSRQLPYGV